MQVEISTPDLEYSRGSTELTNQTLTQTGQGFPELWLDIQPNILRIDLLTISDRLLDVVFSNKCGFVYNNPEAEA